MERSVYVLGPDRDHTIYRYTDQIYKVVQWYRLRGLVIGPKTAAKHYDHKLDASLSRAKSVVLQLALCNEWDYFCTFTISGAKYDRSDLPAWRDSFTQWIRDQRKKGDDIAYLLVPERHKDGSWHAHGLFRGLGAGNLVTFKEWDRSGFRSPNGRRLPRRLVDSDYETWPAYYEKFGNNSFGLIRSQVAAAFYVSKYISKELDRSVSDVGLHLYYCSRGLNRAEKHLDFFGRSYMIENMLQNDYDFCRTGFSKVSDGLDWSFALEYLDTSQLEYVNPLVDDPAQVEAERFYEFDQLKFWG